MFRKRRLRSRLQRRGLLQLVSARAVRLPAPSSAVSWAVSSACCSCSSEGGGCGAAEGRPTTTPASLMTRLSSTSPCEPVRDTKADPPVLAPVMRDDLSFSTPSLSDQATTVNAISASSHVGPVSEREPKSTPTASGPSAPSATSPGSHDSPPSSPLVQYAEDAEDAAPRRREPLILPPRYKEAWGRPRETESEDGTGVFRADDGGSKP